MVVVVFISFVLSYGPVRLITSFDPVLLQEESYN